MSSTKVSKPLFGILLLIGVDYDYGNTQTQAYLDKAKSVLEPRMMYAAVRLSQTIIDIYGASEEESELETFLQ